MYTAACIQHGFLLPIYPAWVRAWSSAAHQSSMYTAWNTSAHPSTWNTAAHPTSHKISTPMHHTSTCRANNAWPSHLSCNGQTCVRTPVHCYTWGQQTEDTHVSGCPLTLYPSVPPSPTSPIVSTPHERSRLNSQDQSS